MEFQLRKLSNISSFSKLFHQSGRDENVYLLSTHAAAAHYYGRNVCNFHDKEDPTKDVEIFEERGILKRECYQHKSLLICMLELSSQQVPISSQSIPFSHPTCTQS